MTKEDQPLPTELAKEAADFLARDFDQCFAQLRHYDTQSNSAVKFAASAHAVLIGAAITLYQVSKSNNVDLAPAVGAVLIGAFYLGLITFLLVVRNRVYYVVVARYINAHRQFFLASKPLGFENPTGMYTDATQPPYFNAISSDSFLLYFVALINSGLLLAVCWLAGFFGWACFIGGATLVIHLVVAISYLLSREGKTADDAVFRITGNN